VKLACFIGVVRDLNWNYSLTSFNISWCLTKNLFFNSISPICGSFVK